MPFLHYTKSLSEVVTQGDLTIMHQDYLHQHTAVHLPRQDFPEGDVIKPKMLWRFHNTVSCSLTANWKAQMSNMRGTYLQLAHKKQTNFWRQEANRHSGFLQEENSKWTTTKCKKTNQTWLYQRNLWSCFCGRSTRMPQKKDADKILSLSKSMCTSTFLGKLHEHS